MAILGFWGPFGGPLWGIQGPNTPWVACYCVHFIILGAYKPLRTIPDVTWTWKKNLKLFFPGAGCRKGWKRLSPFGAKPDWILKTKNVTKSGTRVVKKWSRGLKCGFWGCLLQWNQNNGFGTKIKSPIFAPKIGPNGHFGVLGGPSGAFRAQIRRWLHATVCILSFWRRINHWEPSQMWPRFGTDNLKKDFRVPGAGRAENG